MSTTIGIESVIAVPPSPSCALTTQVKSPEQIRVRVSTPCLTDIRRVWAKILLRRAFRPPSIERCQGKKHVGIQARFPAPVELKRMKSSDRLSDCAMAAKKPLNRKNGVSALMHVFV